MSVLVKGTDMGFRIENFNLGIALDVAGKDLAFAVGFNIDRFRTFAVSLEDNAR